MAISWGLFNFVAILLIHLSLPKQIIKIDQQMIIHTINVYHSSTMALISSMRSSSGLIFILDSFLTAANFSFTTWLADSMASSSEKWSPLLLHMALFKINCPFSIWFIFFSFCSLEIYSKISTLFCLRDSSTISSSFYFITFFNFLYSYEILVLKSPTLSLICWHDSEGFLYSTGGFLRLVWQMISYFVNISTNLSYSIKFLGPRRWTTPPTAFLQQAAHVNTGLNYLPKATFEAGFFQQSWQNCFFNCALKMSVMSFSIFFSCLSCFPVKNCIMARIINIIGQMLYYTLYSTQQNMENQQLNH